MRICNYCKKELIGGSKHIYICGNKLYPNKTKETIRLEFLNFNFPYISIKENLIENYETKLMSLPDIKKEYNIDFKSIIFLLSIYNINRRSISESSHKISQNKYKNTCISRYGVDNVSKTKEVKDKKIKTFLKNYGVDNIRKSDTFKHWLKDYMINTYGVGSLANKNGNANSWGWKTISDEDKCKKLQLLHTPRVSKIEMYIHNILIEYDIEFKSQYFINNRSYDIKILNSNKLIEVNGDYWHANPKIYNESDILFNYKSSKDIWNNDLIKKKLAEDNGYQVLYIWESEIYYDNDNMLKNIKTFLES